MILRNFSNAFEYISWDGNHRFVTNPVTTFTGWYMQLGKTFSALFVENSRLKLRHNDSEIVIRNDYKAIVKGVGDGKKEFALSQAETTMLRFEYLFRRRKEYNQPFDYIDPDDEDWGLFLERIINNPENKDVFMKEMGS